MFVLVSLIHPSRPFADDADGGRVKVIGPFDTADEAREMCNAIGVATPDVLWIVRPLLG